MDVLGHTHDFVVIDTPGHDSPLMRLAHSMADILVTPLNDSFVDLDVLGSLDPDTLEVTGTSHYAADRGAGAATTQCIRPESHRLDRVAEPALQ